MTTKPKTAGKDRQLTEQAKRSMTTEIKMIYKITKDAGYFLVKCPHCNQLVGIEGDDVSEVRGGQYQHKTCSGWIEVSGSARYIRDLYT